MIRVLLGLALSLSLLATPARGDYFSPEPPKAQDTSVVYIYRAAASNLGKKPLRTNYPEILVDGEGAGLLRYNRHIRLELPAGQHEFVATGLTEAANWEPRGRGYTLNLEPGEVA
ncbi:hypothetical protein BST95_01925 [Halioglobus japonicus]|uniref:DUF2846 domain-containing protein n=1 Tax=Halioglobus japonicus TaxID=930805 RepID=A0AAP8MC75_9GAMM|nr:hypothetical protein [Halioglobus japonicus]AQA17160.1 hypothetical protein BST95_01925 [Halioglobus japonicus]PLW85070.1 hypothetical protein C0029_16190 [Halioglobus japonicus]GHD19317.1 hypothetical protein GCM10007052_27620 [Halioglobus japonicus]